MYNTHCLASFYMHFLTVFLFFLFSSFTLADRLFEAEKGDYIVTEQDKNYSLLLIRDKKDTILFEEVTIPSHGVDKSKVDWTKWMESGAPGHSSWIQYEIDASSLELLECYSFSKRGWLYLEESEHFLSRLLSLSLTEIPETERKKVGPAPREEELDRRPSWNPPFFSNGKKTKLSTEAWKARWPKDDTLLSCCQITLYFPPKEISTFPLWIEASNGHFSYAIRTIATGKGMASFLKTSLPRRPPKILDRPEFTESSLKLFIKSPGYYKQFSLFAFDLLDSRRKIGPISFKITKEQDKELYSLEIESKELSRMLTENHRYKWLLFPEGEKSFCVESEDLFLWSTIKFQEKKTSQKEL
jgi:hypothetical protein